MDEREHFAKIESQFFSALKNTVDGPFGNTSGLWDGILANRDNFPNYDQFKVSLSHDASFTSGVGMPVDKSASHAAYNDRFQAWTQRVAKQFTPAELAEWPEPSLGTPTIVEHQGYRGGVLYIKNFSQVHLFREIIRKHHKRQQGLRVLEIGAGYGGVGELLIRMGIAATYTVVDLPQNLFMAAQFVQLTHPHLNGVVCDRAQPTTFAETDLRFALPNDIVLLEGAFDLVINAASLGEMPVATAQAYIAWVSQHLSGDGLFISHNADRIRGAKDVTQRQSDYGYQRFNFERVYPNLPTGGPLHIQHLVMVLSKARAAASPQPDWLMIDRLSALLSLGLNHELEDIFAAVTNPATQPQKSFLETIGPFYSSNSLPDMYQIASVRVNDERFDLVFEFLQGAVALLMENPAACGHFMRYLQKGESPMALSMAALVVKLWGQCQMDPMAEHTLNKALTKVPFYVIKQLGGLKLAAAQVRFTTYLQVA